MKTKITLALLICFAIASCTKWHYGHGHHDDDDPNDKIIYEDTRVDEGATSGKKNIVISPNEIIVKYEPDVSAPERAQIRSEFPIVNVQECDCGDTNIELWVFDPDIEELEIEGVVDRLPSRNPRGKTRGERSFDIQLAPVGPFKPLGQVLADTVGIVGQAIFPSINIAVIDTGLDFQRYLFAETPKQFLFPNGYYSNCFDTGTGWNFTADNNGDGTREGDANFIDDNGHGTYITKIITDELDNKGVTHRILPLKVFDAGGKGSYWDVLCALAYIKSINRFADRGIIDIVNASFGGAMPREIFKEPAIGEPDNIFTEILDDLNKQGTLVITSAGNDGVDNDTGANGDFLSSFKSSNILSVGGYEYDTINPTARPIKLHPLSNYGSDGSVDIALAFNDYKIFFDTGDPLRIQRVTLQGTSYATAAMSAMAGTILNSSGSTSPENLKQLIFDLSIDAPELEGKIADRRVIPRAE